MVCGDDYTPRIFRFRVREKQEVDRKQRMDGGDEPFIHYVKIQLEKKKSLARCMDGNTETVII